MEPYATDLNTANTLLSAMAAVLLTVFWLRVERTPAVGWWTLAAWAAVPSVALVFLRPWLPATLGIVISTLLYSATHVLLVTGVRALAGKPAPALSAVLVISGHLVFLVSAVMLDARIESRMLFNSALWAILALVGAAGFPANQPGHTNPPFRLPKAVLMAHGCFHVIRLLVLLVFLLRGETAQHRSLIQSVSFIETGLFVVGIFAGLLMLSMLERNRQLTQALAEVKTLSGLLPICASCKKIRDHQGYWKQVEEYIETRTTVEFTHGVCVECAERLYGREMRPESGREPENSK